jgi:hypothetical protein
LHDANSNQLNFQMRPAENAIRLLALFQIVAGIDGE